MRIAAAGTVVLSCLIAPIGQSQTWSAQDLRDRVAGFHEPGQRAKFRQIAALLENREAAFSAICAAIQGDHREYLLKIEVLLDQLADDRWAAREDAERQLVEIGARAIGMISERKKSGNTLEERIRSARIVDDIAARGTEEEQAEIRILRGLVNTALYLERSERLANALVSATGHTDPVIVDGALRAIGAVGDGSNAKFLRTRFERLPDAALAQRRTLLGALSELPGPKALEALDQLMSDASMSRDELLSLQFDLRQRDDARALVDKLTGHSDPIVAAAAAIELPEPTGEPSRVSIALGDRSEFEGPMLSIRSDGLEIGQIEGMERTRIPRDQCNMISFGREPQPLASGVVRVFTAQGSLLSGKLLEIGDAAIALESKIFGRVEVPRDEVQGIALDLELDRLVGASTKHDRVRLRDGKLLDGAIGAMTADAIQVGDESIAIGEIAGLLFQRPQPGQRAHEVFTRLDLASGDRLLVHLAAMNRSHVGFVMPGIGQAVVPITDVARLEFGVGGGALWGFTLVADYSENTIFELDDQKNVVFKLEEMYGVWDAECLDNGNLLVVEFALGRVVEMRRDRTEVWSFDQLKNPYDADRLPNGNTLIADTYGHRVIEVNPKGEIVWNFEGQSKPLDVERLPNGNTLIADGRKDRVIEVNASGEIVWQQNDLEGVWDVDRLPNGNTLITQRRSGHRVFEIDRDGKIVFEINDLTSPSDADRLPNGHTIVAEDGKVREFDRFGNPVWEHNVAWSVEVNRY